MRGQLSFEFMIYTAVSMAATVGMLALYLKGRTLISHAGSGPMLAEFEALAGYSMAGSSRFYAFLPSGICRNGTLANVSAALRAYGNGNGVDVSNGICAMAGEFSKMAIYRSANGSYVLEGVHG